MCKFFGTGEVKALPELFFSVENVGVKELKSIWSCVILRKELLLDDRQRHELTTKKRVTFYRL